MFYTLASRIPLISNSSSDGKFFKIFLVGSLIYILLHYYLYSAERWFVLEKLKTYLYYVMAIDLAVAYFLSKWNAPEDDTDEEKQSDDSYSRDQRLEIEKNLQDLRRMQSMQAEQHRQKMLQEREKMREQDDENAATASQKSPFMTREEAEKEGKDTKSKHSRKSKSSSSHTEKAEEQKDKYKKKQKDRQVETDTHIDVYMGSN
jgi:hypothetical protein